MIQANSKHMQKLPFASELDITLLFFIVITGHLLITQTLKYFFSTRVDSNFSFYLNLILFFMIISNIFRMITINGFQFSILKLNIYCSIIYVIVLFILFFGFREFLHFSFEREFQKLNYHISTILSDINDDHIFNFSFEVFLVISILLSGLFVFILLPSISRFGENYVKIIQKYYCFIDSENKPHRSENKAEEMEPIEIAEIDKKKKEQQKINRVLRIFNLRLIFNLLILFFWIKPMMVPWADFIGSKEMINILRILFCLTYAIIAAFGYRYELEIHFSKIYETIKTLMADPGPQQLAKVQLRVSNLVQTSLMVTYIIVSKFLIPLILLYILIYKSNFNHGFSGNLSTFKNYRQFLGNERLNLTVTQKNDVIALASDWNCMAELNYKEIFRQMKNCPLNQKLVINKIGIGLGFYNVKQEKYSGDLINLLKEILRKINNYGLIPDEFYQNVLSFWLFNYFLANYFLSVFYIIFLRKSSNF